MTAVRAAAAGGLRGGFDIGDAGGA